MKKNKADKKKYVDDGHTIYNMYNVPQAFYRRKSTDKNVGLNRKERRAAIRAALATYLPMFLCTIFCFAIVGLLMYLWLS